MTIGVEVTEDVADLLTRIGVQKKMTREELAARVLQLYGEVHAPVKTGAHSVAETLAPLRGLWADTREDSAAYQVQLRNEWPD